MGSRVATPERCKAAHFWTPSSVAMYSRGEPRSLWDAAKKRGVRRQAGHAKRCENSGNELNNSFAVSKSREKTNSK